MQLLARYACPRPFCNGTLELDRDPVHREAELRCTLCGRSPLPVILPPEPAVPGKPRRIHRANPSRPKAPQWTDADDTLIIARFREGLPVAAIAAELHRSTLATAQHIGLLRATGEWPEDLRRYRSYTPDEDAIIREMVAADQPDKAIALRIDRSIESISGRRALLGLYTSRRRR